MSKNRLNASEATSLGGCGCWIVLLVFNLALGGWSVNYLLQWWFEKNIPFIFDTIIGLFIAEVSVPVAVIGAILRHFGVL